MANEPIAGKYLLEILTRGMYSNSLHVYREYIQNAVDSIDVAITKGIVSFGDAEISIDIDEKNRKITIRDNGCGVSKNDVVSSLVSIGASDKSGVNERGFRGIGRIAGLTYADEVRFVTTAKGESIKTAMICDCVRLQGLLKKSNTETQGIMETFEAITNIEESEESEEAHYFEVQLINVHPESHLLDEEEVTRYLSETAPVDFDGQKFMYAKEIREHFEQRGYPIPFYAIRKSRRKKDILKTYKSLMKTGKQARTEDRDYVRRIEFFEECGSDGKTLYIAWLAITDFKGAVADDSLSGIRFRKGNILVGDNTTFSKFFPSEGNVANRMFVGEVHVLHEGILPNSQRDDFEDGEMYREMAGHLSTWAGMLNKKYRRGTSKANSAKKKLEEQTKRQCELEEKINSGIITSDKAREDCLSDLEKIEKAIKVSEREVRKALEEGIFDPEQVASVEQVLEEGTNAEKETQRIRKRIVDADYATKNDLPSSYSKAERRVYQRIIEVIDEFFSHEQDTRDGLRNAIIEELSVKKK